MSDSLAAAVAALPGVPEQLVMRSASARATAQGVAVDQVLAAWGGGGSVSAGSAPAAAAPAAAAAAPVVQAAPKAAPAATAVVPTPIEVEIPDAEEPIDPPAIGARLRQGFRLGAFLGALGGLAAAMQIISASFDAMGVMEGVATATVDPGGIILSVAAIMAVVGALIAHAVAFVPAAMDRDFRTERHPLVTSFVGLGAGSVFGAVLGAVVASRGFADILDEAVVHIPVGSSFLVAVVGGAIVGGLVGVTSQAAAIPSGLGPEEHAAALVVRKRLATGYIFPVLILAAIGVFVVSIGTILLTFHAIAPLIAVVVAGSILTFAFLSGGRPKIKVGLTEVVVILATLGVLVYFMVLISNAMSGHA